MEGRVRVQRCETVEVARHLLTACSVSPPTESPFACELAHRLRFCLCLLDQGVRGRELPLPGSILASLLRSDGAVRSLGALSPSGAVVSRTLKN